MAVQKGDYIGFSIGDRHSSDLGIVRVSTNDRYIDNMLPVITDKTIQIPGGDGTFYFGSNYPSKTIHIDFAFDSLNDLQIREIIQILASKKLQKLIFDEAPYKYYWVKSSGQPQIKYLSFDEAIGTLTTKVSKGEGSVDLIAYKPFAYSVYKFLDEYESDNIDEWAAASGMLESQTIGSKTYDSFNTDGSNLVSTYIYNAGEMDTDYKLIMKFNGSFIGIDDFAIELDNDPTAQLQLNKINKKGTDTYLILNTAAQILEGAIKVENEYVKTGNIYNEYITAGNFFKLPQGESVLKITNAISGSMTPSEYFSINYSYLYY